MLAYAKPLIVTNGVDERLEPSALARARCCPMTDDASKRKQQLITAVYEALPRGGTFIVIEYLIDNDRRENVAGLMMSLQNADRVRRWLRLCRH